MLSAAKTSGRQVPFKHLALNSNTSRKDEVPALVSVSVRTARLCSFQAAPVECRSSENLAIRRIAKSLIASHRGPAHRIFCRSHVRIEATGDNVGEALDEVRVSTGYVP